jgi:hypothetical protein
MVDAELDSILRPSIPETPHRAPAAARKVTV